MIFLDLHNLQNIHMFTHHTRLFLQVQNPPLSLSLSGKKKRRKEKMRKKLLKEQARMAELAASLQGAHTIGGGEREEEGEEEKRMVSGRACACRRSSMRSIDTFIYTT